MRYRICVDKELCQGHSMCVAEAPGLFGVSDQGQIYDTVELLVATDAGEKEIASARAAARACPNGVISLVPVDD